MRRFLLPGFLVLAAYWAFFGGEYSVADAKRARAQLDVAGAELAVLQDQARRLESRVEALEHDPRTLETLAREHFGMIRPGEILYRFADGGGEGGDEVDTGSTRR
jgi:cell division protein FtsB